MKFSNKFIRQLILSISSFALVILTYSTATFAEEKVFALIPKAMNNPFFDQARDGCKQAEKEISGIKCLYIGPSQHSEEEQMRIIEDLITRRVAGIAVAPTNSKAVARKALAAKAAGIPVITWDNDFSSDEKASRVTYIGSRNYDIGVELGKLLLQIKPNGGTLAIQSGAAAALNLSERVQGLRDTINGKGFTEVTTNPFFSMDDASLAVQQMSDILTKHPDLGSFVAVGAWPQIAHQAYKQALFTSKAKLDSNQLAVIIADTLPIQMELLKDGFSHGQVGQRPFEMGYEAMRTLKKITDGESVADPIYTGLDICTKENAATCLSGT